VITVTPTWCYPGDIDELDIMIWCADDRAIMVVDQQGAIVDYDNIRLGGCP